MPSSLHISDASFRIGERMPLPDDEVHLWRVDLAAVATAEQRWRQILSADERARAARFHFPRDRQSYSSTRALLRTILAGYMASDPTALIFRYSEKEKPSLSMGGKNSVEFNVSHSGSTALLAFARERALGVDVEKLREDFDPEAIARRFFSDDEQQQLATLPAAEKYRGFFRCWTRKEAYIKARGDGLSLPLHQFDVSLRLGDEGALLATRPDGAETARWSLREVPAGNDCIGALCVQGHGWRLKV